jgi:hypothetical protein
LGKVLQHGGEDKAKTDGNKHHARDNPGIGEGIVELLDIHDSPNELLGGAEEKMMWQKLKSPDCQKRKSRGMMQLAQ